jgi:hypothetical protein
MMTEILLSTPFVLSLSKGIHRQQPHFDKLRANDSNQGILLS